MIRAAGIDTWSPSWYVGDQSRAARVLRQLATVPTAAGGRLLPDRIAGHRVGWWPSAGIMFAEGHPAAALDGRQTDRLCSPDDLVEAHEIITGALADQGLRMRAGRSRDHWLPLVREYGISGVRRLDSTVDVALESAAEGLAIMAGIAALDIPRCAKAIRYGTAGAIQTIEIRGASGRKILGRVYDKGVERGVATRGRWLRLEDQRRWVKHTRRDAAELTSSYVRTMFQQRFFPLWQASRGITVAGPVVLAERLWQLVEAEEITPAHAETLAGYCLLSQVATVLRQAGAGFCERTVYRRRAALRKQGLVLADGVLEEVEVDVSALIEEALESDAWRRRS